MQRQFLNDTNVHYIGYSMHLAARDGHTEIVRVLLNRSANVNARDKRMDGTSLGGSRWIYRNCNLSIG